MALSHVFSSPIADFTGTVTVFNSAGATVTANATEIVRPSNWNSAHNEFLTISGNTAGASTMSGTNIVLQGGNGVTLSANGASLIFSSPDQTVQTQNMVSLQGSTGAIVFSNSNGVSFGGNASTITASHNGLTSQSNQAFSAPGGSSAFQTLVFANSQGVSWSNSNGSVVGSVQTNYAASDHSHGNPTLALTNLSGTTASNSAGLTLSLSAANPAGGAFSAGLSGGNTSGDTGTVNNQIVFAGGNNITVSGSTNAGGMSVTISGANAGGAQTGISGIIVSNTTYTSGTVSFSNANGISFGSSAGQAITASYTVPTVTNSSWTVSDAASSATVGRLAFTNLNGVTLSLSTGAAGSHTIVGSHNALTSQSNQAFSADASSTFQTLTFQNSNGVSFSNNAGALRVTHDLQFTSATSAITSNALHSSASRVINIVAATNNTGGGTASQSGNVSFSAANGITFYTSAGGAVVASHNALTTARASTDAVGLNTALTAGPLAWTVNSSGISLNAGSAAGTTSGFTGANISASITHNTAGLAMSMSVAAPGGAASATLYATGNTTQSSTGTMALSSMIVRGSNGVSAGISNGSIIVDGPSLTSLSVTGALSASSNGSTISLGVGTVTLSATSNTTQGSSGTVNLNALIFAGAGAASVGVSNGSIVISAPNAAAGNVTFSAGTSSGGFASIVFSNSNGVSFGLNGSTITASAVGGGAESNNINLLGANTSGNTTASGSTLGFSGVNLTLSGTNASQIVFSAPATSSLVGTNGISVSTAGSTISVLPVPGANLEIFQIGNNSAFSTMGLGTIYFQQFIPNQHVTFAAMERRFSGSSVSSTNNQVAAHTYSYGLYSRETGANSSRYTQIGASSIYFAASFNSNTGAGWTVSQGAASVTNTSAGTANLSAITGFKHMYFPFAGTVTEGGQYAIAMWMSSATTGGTSPLRIGVLELTNINNLTIGRVDTAAGFSISNASRIGDFGQGVYSSSSSNLPASIAVSGFTNAVSQARMYIQLD